jgi:hypothetical protein
VRYSIIRSGPVGNAIRVEVSTRIAGYLALYRVNASGKFKRVYPDSDPATLALPNATIQIPSNPMKIGNGEKLRLVLVPAPQSAVSGGAVGGTFRALETRSVLTSGIQAPTTPLVIDIPLAP